MSSTDPTRRSGTPLYRRSTTILTAIGAYAILSAAVLWLVEGLPTAVRLPLALPLLLFAPGYALLAALFPPSSERRDGGLASDERPALALAPLERAILAVVASIAIVPAVALAANAVVGVRVGVVLAGVAAVTVLGAVVGVYRAPRENAALVPGDREHRVLGGDWRRALTDPVTILAVVLCVALLGSSAALAVTGGGTDSPGTEFYVVDDGAGSNGSADGTDEIRIRIAQDGVETQRYTVVAVLSRAESGNSARSWSELDRFATTVPAGEAVTESYRLPPSAGEDGAATLRLLLYTGDAPADPDRKSAHRTLRISVESA